MLHRGFIAQRPWYVARENHDTTREDQQKPYTSTIPFLRFEKKEKIQIFLFDPRHSDRTFDKQILSFATTDTHANE